MKTLKVLLGILIISLGGMSCGQKSDESQTSTLDSTTSLGPVVDSTWFNFNAENEFLGLGTPQFGDLDSMIARRRIRVLVPYTYLYYTINLKQRSGIAFEALNLFEASLNKQLHLKLQDQVRI